MRDSNALKTILNPRQEFGLVKLIYCGNNYGCPFTKRHAGIEDTSAFEHQEAYMKYNAGNCVFYLKYTECINSVRKATKALTVQINFQIGRY